MVQVTALACITVTFMFCVTAPSAKATRSANPPHDTALHYDRGSNFEVGQSQAASIRTQTQTQHMTAGKHVRLSVPDSDGGKASRHDTRSDANKAPRHDTQSDANKASRHDTQSDANKAPRHDARSDANKVPRHDTASDRSKASQTETLITRSKASRHNIRSPWNKESRHITRNDGNKLSRHDVLSRSMASESGEDTVSGESNQRGGHAARGENVLSGKRVDVNRPDSNSEIFQDVPNGNEHTQNSSNRASHNTIDSRSSSQRDFERDDQYSHAQSDIEHIPGRKRFESKTNSDEEKSENLHLRLKFSLPLDLSRCGSGHCSCFNSTSSNVYARCSDRGLKPMPTGGWPSFPAALYSFVIANQDMRHVPLEQLLPYRNLRMVDASGNSVTHLSLARTNRTMPLHDLDFSHSGIHTIDCSYFSHMPDLRTLKLTKNLLVSIDRCTFRALHYLEYLDLSMNRIRTLTNGSFENQVNLRRLLLNSNHFSYLKQLTTTVLQPLQQLRVLQIHGSGHLDTGLYPDKALSTLTRLQELSIDGAHGARFGPPMKALTQLTVLNFGFGDSGKCFVKKITSDFFVNVPYLKSLTIGNCRKLESISPDAFDPTPHLEELGFSNIVYSLKQLLSELSWLRTSSIRKLTLSGVHNHTQSSIDSACHFLEETDASNLRFMSRLQELDLSHNRLNLIKNSFLQLLPKSLKHLNISSNLLTPPNSVLIQGLCLSNLTVLDETNQLHVTDNSWGNAMAPTSQNQNQAQSATSSKHQQKRDVVTAGKARESREFKGENVAPTTPGVDVGLKCGRERGPDHRCASSNQSGERSRVSKSVHTESAADVPNSAAGPVFGPPQMPPKLIVYTASGAFRLGKSFSTSSGWPGTAKLLNLSNTYLNDWGRIYTLPPYIEIADFSLNYCDSLHRQFLEPGNSLRQVYLQRNVLGNTLGQDKGNALRYFNNVTTINLSENFVHYLSRESMMGLVSAQYIDLSRNRLQVFDVRLAHMTSLKVLDLSVNLLEWISAETRNDLDTLVQNHSVILNLYPNPLKCTCDSIELLKWLATTKVWIFSKEFMFCFDENKRKHKIGDFSERVSQLQRSCTSKAYVIVLSAFSVVIGFLVVGGGILYRYRWKFIYWKNVTLANYYGFRGGKRGQEGNAPRFRFDAYVLYSQEDRNFVLHECLNELETKRGHRLCVEDRDFLLGSYMPGAITSAVRTSAHTVPVVSPDFLEEGEWCEYGLNMASMESIQNRRTLLHPLLLHPVPHDEMPGEILESLQANQYSEYPPEVADEDVRQAFWDAVSRALGHVGEVGAVMED